MHPCAMTVRNTTDWRITSRLQTELGQLLRGLHDAPDGDLAQDIFFSKGRVLYRHTHYEQGCAHLKGFIPMTPFTASFSLAQTAPVLRAVWLSG